MRHVVVTRFSLRLSSEAHTAHMYSQRVDPLQPERLAFRFKLFEMVCLPALLNQSSGDFDWILLVDPELPDEAVGRLKNLVGPHPRAILHRAASNDDLRTLSWMEQYFGGQHDYVVTTNVDDDDALPRRYLAAVRDAISARIDAANAPVAIVLGTTDVLEWDLAFSDDCPLGSMAPWHRRYRGKPFPVTCGFTLCARQPVDWTVYALPSHEHAAYLFNPAYPHPECSALRERLRPFCSPSGSTDLAAAGCFIDLAGRVAPVVMTNHHYNDQAKRLNEPKNERRPVTREGSFADVVLDWGAVAAIRRKTFDFNRSSC